MKTSSLRLLIIFLVAALSAKVMAGTISGNISYTGTSTGQIIVAAFQAQDSTVSLMMKNSPIVMVQLNSPGIYSLTGLSDGTYYIVSVMGMDSQNNVKITDPWGLYGTLVKLTPITIAGGNTVSGINLTLVDGTIENPNPFSNNENSAGTISGNISYTGTSTGQIIVAAFQAQDSTVSLMMKNSPIVMVQLNSPGIYSLTGLSAGTYYIVSVMGMDSQSNLKITDPWGLYGTLVKLTPVTIAGGNTVSGINITLVDGTIENPNPFANVTDQPDQTLQLPSITNGGTDPILVYDGSSIYLFKHDNEVAANERIYKINRSTGEVTDNYTLSLSNVPNGISWVNALTFFKGDFWATGGYGDPSGSGGKKGIFKVNISTSTSSNQITGSSGINSNAELGGLTNDGVNFYVGVILSNPSQDSGFVKFNPGQVSQIPTSPFYKLSREPQYLSYGGGLIWVGVNNVIKFDVASGNFVGNLNIPGSAASVYLDQKLWMYDQSDNTLKAYSVGTVNVAKETGNQIPLKYNLSQNYPNPFNPSTTISFSLPSKSFVSLKIFDVVGREVATLVSQELSAGNYKQQWNANGMPSGVYFYRLQSGSFTETKKLILLK